VRKIVEGSGMIAVESRIERCAPTAVAAPEQSVDSTGAGVARVDFDGLRTDHRKTTTNTNQHQQLIRRQKTE